MDINPSYNKGYASGYEDGKYKQKARIANLVAEVNEKAKQITDQDIIIAELTAERDDARAVGDKAVDAYSDLMNLYQALRASLPTVPKLLMEECGTCKGEMYVMVMTENGGEGDQCPTCHGDGEVPVKCWNPFCDNGVEHFHCATAPAPDKPCGACDGHGYATEQVVVMPGMEVWMGSTNGPVKEEVWAVQKGNIIEAPRGLHINQGFCYATKATAKILGGAV